MDQLLKSRFLGTAFLTSAALYLASAARGRRQTNVFLSPRIAAVCAVGSGPVARARPGAALQFGTGGTRWSGTNGLGYRPFAQRTPVSETETMMNR
mmetsp:Transcript_6070/g.13083  ORF Transcript_6070/g.13083 Transcript_6070/m.13083 type:complete len:96 (-) Transcript_6070:223-510(-)